jgi:hypothetical protein
MVLAAELAPTLKFLAAELAPTLKRRGVIEMGSNRKGYVDDVSNCVETSVVDSR